MKRSLSLLIFLIIGILGFSQELGLTKDSTYLESQGDTVFFVTRIMEYGAGPDRTETVRELIGDSLDVVRFLESKVIQTQRLLTNAARTVLSKNVFNAEFNTINQLINNMSGGPYWRLSANRFFNRLEGRYRIVTATDNFLADLTRTGNGANIKFERVDNADEWTVRIFTARNFRILNYDGSNRDVYFLEDNNGRLKFKDLDNHFTRIVKVN